MRPAIEAGLMLLLEAADPYMRRVLDQWAAWKGRLREVSQMARIKENTRAKLMMWHGLAMLGLGMLLFYARDTMLVFYGFGCALAMMLIAASLILLATLDWICVVGHGPEQASKLRGLLLVSVGAAASGAFLALYPGATIRMFCYVIAIYALLLGFGKYQLARSWKGTGRAQTFMYVLATMAMLFGVLLLISAGWDAPNVIAVLALYSLFMGAQMLLSMFYLHESLDSMRLSTGSKRTEL